MGYLWAYLHLVKEGHENEEIICNNENTIKNLKKEIQNLKDKILIYVEKCHHFEKELNKIK